MLKVILPLCAHGPMRLDTISTGAGLALYTMLTHQISDVAITMAVSLLYLMLNKLLLKDPHLNYANRVVFLSLYMSYLK